MIPPISHLGKRLVLSILLMGGLLTLIGTSLQLTLELRRDWHEVENSLDSVRSSHLRSLTEAAWNFDHHQLELQLDSLLTLPWISGASVHFGGDGAQTRTLHRGDLALSRDLSRSLPLVQTIGGRLKSGVWNCTRARRRSTPRPLTGCCWCWSPRRSRPL